jgi:predicted RNase H-like HicB family nuclease
MDLSYKLPFTFKIEKDDAEYHAWCPELPGCHTHGKTPHVALENLKDAVQLYLDTIMEEEIARQTAQLLDEA